MNKDNCTSIIFILLVLFMGFGFPITTIHCDKVENICKVGRPFFLVPNILTLIKKYKQFNSIEFNKIKKVEVWQGHQKGKFGYNIGFHLKNSSKHVFYGNETGDLHIISYSMLNKSAKEFCSEFNNFIQDESVKSYSKIFYPEWVIELIIMLILTLFFRLNYVIKNNKLTDGILTIIFCSIIFSIPVIFITFIISFFE